MTQASIETVCGVTILSQAMRAIRKKRGMTSQMVASAMAMPLRTYEQFESGRGPMTDERLFSFAEATDSDPFALLLAPILKSAAFAIDCADSKFVTIVMMHLEEFAEREGGDIVHLEPPLIIGGCERLFREFSLHLANSEAFLQKWLDGRTGTIGLKTLRLRGVKRQKRS